MMTETLDFGGTFSLPACNNVVLTTTTDKQLVIGLEGDTITVTGDAKMDEAAEQFFKCVLKGIVDDYIQDKLS